MEASEYPVHFFVDNQVVRGIWHLPAKAGPVPAVLCIHGFTLSKNQYTVVARRLARQGLAVLRLDLRGHGESGGSIAHLGFNDQLDDLFAAVSWMLQQKEVEPNRIGLLGFSLGGGLCAVAARLYGFPRIRSLVMWAPMLDARVWNEMIEQLYGKPRSGVLAVVNGIEVSEKVFEQVRLRDPLHCARLYEGPVFIAHSLSDERLPADVSKQMKQDRLQKNLTVESYFSDFSGHMFDVTAEKEQLLSRSVDFFERTL